MALKRVTTKEGEVYFVDDKTGERVKTGMEVRKVSKNEDYDQTKVPDFSDLPEYYQNEFFLFTNTEGYEGKWNWAAFFFSWIWALSKGIMGIPLLLMIIGLILGSFTYGITGILVFVVMGLKGNKIYFDHYMKKFGRE